MSYVVEALPVEGGSHSPPEITPDPLSDDFLSWVQLTTTRPGTWPDTQRSSQFPPTVIEPELPLLSSYADQRQRARRLQASQKKKLVWSYESELDAARGHEAECKKKVAEAEDLLKALEQQYGTLLERMQGASHSHASPNEKVSILRERLGECMRAIEKQQLALEHAREEDDVALASRLALEVQAKGLEDLDGAVADPDGETAFLTQLASRRKEDESANAKRYRKASRKLRLLADEERLKQAERDRAVLEEAEAGRRGAAARMKATIAAIRQNESAKDSGRHSERNRKAAALLQLKRNTEAIKADVESKNVTRQRRLKLAEEARAKEAEALLKSGKNPYENFRRREQEEARARERARLDATRRRQEAEFAVGMEAEAAQQQKVTARMKAFEGRQVPMKLDDPDRWRKYLEARALPGLELSEITKPGGFLPSQIADPSKILNKYQLGLGIASKSTVDALQKIYHESPSELLIPRSPNKPSDARSNGHNQTDETPPFVGASDESDAVGNDENVVPGARPHARSVWEERRLAAARARHKEAMKKKQVVWGKEFSGAAFLPTPAEIVFKDFEVGQTYRSRFTLTNLSYTFNTFKIGELSDVVRDFFVVEYAFPGQVSAGMSCEVKITFTPKVNEDIFEELPVLAETGPVSVPIRCLIKRTVISTEPSSNRLDFGMVTRAEKSVRTLTIENRGALPTTFRLEEEGGEDDRGQFLLSYTKLGAVGGYSKARIDFTYAPLDEGPLRKTMVVKFSSKEVGDLRVEVSGACGDVPIYLHDEEVDFKCCMVDEVYRNVLVVANRGKTSMKVTLTPPKPLAGCLQIVPELGYVQAGTTFSFQLKFSPTKNLLKSFGVNSNEERLSSLTLNVPMRLRIPEQTFPVAAVLKATLTSAELQFSPASLDFDTCTVGESVARTLNLTNPSALPLRYGFNPLPKGISVKPGDGYGSLLPGESVERSVIFTPHAATLYSFQLSCWTSLAPAEPFKVPCVGTGVLSPLVFSANRLELPATPLGSATTTTLILKNVSAAPQSFEFAVPPTGGAVRISPSVDTIPPGKTTTIQVEFSQSQNANITEARDADVADGEPEHVSACDETRPASDAPLSVGQEIESHRGANCRRESSDVTKCIRQKFVIPCLIKRHRVQASSEGRITNLVTAAEPAGNAGSTSAGCVTLHLEIHTTVIEPQLAIEDVPGGPDPQGFYPLNFGQVPVGKRVVKTFTLRHVGSRPMRILATPLGHDGIFTRVNALRELHPCEEASPAEPQQGGVGFSGESNPLESEGAGSSDTRVASGLEPEMDQRSGVEGSQQLAAGHEPKLQEDSQSAKRASSADETGITQPADVTGAPSTSATVGPNPAAAKPPNPSKRPPSQQKVVVEFSPAARIRYREVMHILTNGGLGVTKLSVLLLGEGICPTMHLDPEITAVDLGHVLAGESVEKGFAIVNTSPFALTFRLRLDGTVQRNRNGMEPIYCKPAEGTIEAGQRAPVAIVFNPDRPGCSYRAQILVEVPNQDKEVRINLSGCCWDQALFCTGTDPADEPSESNGLSKSATVTLVADAARALPSRTLTLGCAEGGKQGGKAPSGEFTIEGLEKGSVNATQGWSVDVSKGSLAPGERKPVTFSYSAPKRTGGEGVALLELGESVEAKVVLHWKGGSIPPKEPQVHLTLRCESTGM